METKIELTESEKVTFRQLQQYGSVGIKNCTCGLVACWIDYKLGRSYVHATTAKNALEIMLERMIEFKKTARKYAGSTS